jgi:hypothetical protein
MGKMRPGQSGRPANVNTCIYWQADGGFVKAPAKRGRRLRAFSASRKKSCVPASSFCFSFSFCFLFHTQKKILCVFACQPLGHLLAFNQNSLETNGLLRLPDRLTDRCVRFRRSIPSCRNAASPLVFRATGRPNLRNINYGEPHFAGLAEKIIRVIFIW